MLPLAVVMVLVWFGISALQYTSVPQGGVLLDGPC